MPVCVGAGVAAWLALSIVPFLGFAGCWLAGYLHRSTPLEDALAGALAGGAGTATAALAVAAVGPIGIPLLPAEAFSLGTALANVAGGTPLATYLSVAYVSFLATVGALLGLLGGYSGSDGYGEPEGAHRRAIEVGRTHRSPERGPGPDDHTGPRTADRSEDRDPPK